MHHNVEVRYNSTVPKDLKVSNGKSEGSDWFRLCIVEFVNEASQKD